MDELDGPIPEAVREIKEILESAGHKVNIPTHATFKNPGLRCVCCGVKDDLRFDFCFACAEAQSVIGTGKDMYNRGVGGIEISGKEATQRLKLLIKNGWRLVPSCEEAIREFPSSPSEPVSPSNA